MNTKELIRDIDVIYKQFTILPNLQLHMLRAAAVAAYIMDHWQGPSINKDNVIAACLVHDLANIVKVDFSHAELLGPEAKRLAYWRLEQAKAIQKYGSEEHAATDTMLAAIESPDRVRKLVQDSAFANNIMTADSGDWEQKIVAYADIRTGPFGIITLHERLVDAKRRYAGKQEFSTDPRVPIIGAAYSIEEQLSKHVSVSVENITDDNIVPYLQRFSA